MQTSLLFVDLTFQGLPPDIGKIAIKMPKGQGELNADVCGGFADIINALMSTVPPEELQESLDQMEWVRMEEDGATGLVPLFDLTQEQGKATGMAYRLLNEAVPESVHPSEKLRPILFPSGSGTGGQKTDGAAESATHFGRIQQKPGEFSARTDLPLSADSVRPFAMNGDSNPTPSSPQSLSEKNLAEPKPGSDHGALKQSASDDTAAREIPDAIRAFEGLKADGKSESTAKAFSQMTSQNPHKVKPTGGMGMGQQPPGDEDGGAQLSMQHNAGKQAATETSFREFKPGLTENSIETTGNSSELIDKSGVEPREVLQTSMAKGKSPGGDRMEILAGGKEVNTPNPQDQQSNVIRQIVQRMTLQTQGSQSTMSIKLKPEFLGNVHMQIVTDHQQVVVRMATESLAVKEMVEQGLQHLKTELQQHGLEIDKFDVFVANDKEESKQGQDWAGFRQALKRRHRDGNKQDGDDKKTGDLANSPEIENRRSSNSAREVDYFA